MEHALRCNNMKCRAELRERALVTTCRYSIFFPSQRGGHVHRTDSRPDQWVIVTYSALTVAALQVSLAQLETVAFARLARPSCRDLTTPW